MSNSEVKIQCPNKR